jgi:hypothetical protein
MEMRNLLDIVVTTVQEGRCEDALLIWATHQTCGSADCNIRTGAGTCSENCILPRLLEMSLVYNRDNAYAAYLELKKFVASADYTRFSKAASGA